MNIIRKSLTLLVLAALPVLASAQNIPQRLELVQIEREIDSFSIETLEVFNMPAEGANHYYLTVGRLGIGDDVIQAYIDPLSELFIPLGESVAEALESMQQLQSLFKEQPGTGLETAGCVAIGFPNEKLEPVRVTYRKPLLTKSLEFTVQRDTYSRSAQMQKSDFDALVRGVKFYQRLHPNE